jgi:hypothetical protein
MTAVYSLSQHFGKGKEYGLLVGLSSRLGTSLIARQIGTSEPYCSGTNGTADSAGTEANVDYAAHILGAVPEG